jgi:acylphosphatase
VDRVSRRFRVTCRVQGVYFRQSTRAQAQRLALLGYARNMPDGSVEVLAHGVAEAVTELHGWLKRGPSGARVDGVLEIDLEPDAASPLAEFQVL